MVINRGALLALHRYWIWADWLRILFDAELGEPARPAEQESDYDLHRDLYLSYWYAALYVVVEGWDRLGLSDKVVDDLVGSPNTGLLRRYRNAIFHFQPKYWDDRRLAFMNAGNDTVPWVRQLHAQMGRALLEILRNATHG